MRYPNKQIADAAREARQSAPIALQKKHFLTRREPKPPICYRTRKIYDIGGLCCCSMLLLPNNLNIFIAFDDKFRSSAKDDIIRYCLSKRIYPMNNTIIKYIFANAPASTKIEKIDGKIYFNFSRSDGTIDNGWRIRTDIHTNMIMNDFIPDDLPNKLVVFIINDEKHLEKCVPIATLCKYFNIDHIELENLMISELHKHYAKDKIFHRMRICGCCIHAVSTDANNNVDDSDNNNDVNDNCNL